MGFQYLRYLQWGFFQSKLLQSCKLMSAIFAMGFSISAMSAISAILICDICDICDSERNFAIFVIFAIACISGHK